MRFNTRLKKYRQVGIDWCLAVGRSTALVQLQQNAFCQSSPIDIAEMPVDPAYMFSLDRSVRVEEYGTTCSRRYAGASPFRAL